VIVLKSLTQQLVSARCAPVEQVVEPDFHHLDIAVAGGERIAGKDQGRGRYDEGPVAQPEIVVFQLHRPIVREGVFEARAEQPAAGIVAAVGECAEAAAGERHARVEVGDCQAVVADPATAGLAVEQPVIDGDAEAGSQCRDPAIVVGDHNGSGRSDDPVAVVVVAGPVEVPLAADDEVVDLVIDADLSAADECAVVAAVVEVRQQDRVRPGVAGPGTANVAADVESGSTEHRQRRRWRRGLHRHICGSGDRRTKHRKRYARD